MRGEEQSVTEMDWSIFDHEGVDEACTYAAHRVANSEEYGEYVEYEDLCQEARIRAASMPDRAWACINHEGLNTLGTLGNELYYDLIDMARTMKARGQRNESADARYDDNQDDYDPPFQVATGRSFGSSYDRQLVELLMPAVWDEAYCFGMQVENAPDADMPRSQPNKATGNTLWAHLADIRIGWQKAPLTIEERRALFLTYCMDWTQREIAFNQSCSQKTISNRLYTGVGKIVAQLNGGDFMEFFTGRVA